MNYNIRFLESGVRDNAPFPFYIYKLKCKAGYIAIDAHWHEEIEILYTTCSGILEINNRCIHFEKNTFLFINKEQLHLVNAHSDGYLYAFVFKYEFLDFKNKDYCQEEIIDNLKNKLFLFPQFTDINIDLHEEIYKLLLDIISLYYSSVLGRELKIKCNLYQLIFLLYTNNAFIHSDNNQPPAASLTYVKEAISFMENNYAQPINVEDLANNSSISKYYLIKLFKKITGKSPMIYLRDLRIDISKDFLAQGYTVTETTFLTGFNNVSYYIRHFKEANGLSPKEYQKTCQ